MLLSSSKTIEPFCSFSFDLGYASASVSLAASVCVLTKLFIRQEILSVRLADLCGDIFELCGTIQVYTVFSSVFL